MDRLTLLAPYTWSWQGSKELYSEVSPNAPKFLTSHTVRIMTYDGDVIPYIKSWEVRVLEKRSIVHLFSQWRKNRSCGIVAFSISMIQLVYKEERSSESSVLLNWSVHLIQIAIRISSMVKKTDPEVWSRNGYISSVNIQKILYIIHQWLNNIHHRRCLWSIRLSQYIYICIYIYIIYTYNNYATMATIWCS